MRIGIDIDDTITNTWNYFIPIFSEKFNIPMNKIKQLPPYYGSIKEIVSLEEYFSLMRKHEDLMQEMPLKPDVKEILTKLKEEGNTIIFITARGNKGYSDPYLITKKYLDDNSIPYDKIIINAYEKGTVCKKEKIDLFIDDNLKNCIDVSNQGIEVIMMEAEYNINDIQFTRMKNWKQVYEYIKNRW